MARKSAARMKPAGPKSELRPIEDVFNEAKDMFVMTVDVQVKTAKRVDNLMNIRDFCDKFWKNDGLHESLKYYKSMQNLSVETYEKIRDIAKTFELVDFRAIEVKDYFADLIPDVEKIEDMEELCKAALIFMSVQPYGSKLIQLHKLMQDEFAQRDILED